MIPIFMLLGACFSDATRHSGCNELRTADIKYYKIDKAQENGKNYLDTEFGKKTVAVIGTLGYTIYKREIHYAWSSYSVKLTENEASAGIRLGW